MRQEGFYAVGAMVGGRWWCGGLDRGPFRGRGDEIQCLPGIVCRDVFILVICPIGAECHRASPYGDIL